LFTFRQQRFTEILVMFRLTKNIQRIQFLHMELVSLLGSTYCRVFVNRIHTIIIRQFNVFSARMDPNNPYSGVIARFIHRVKKGLPPVIYGDGKQTRDFVHVRDVVNFIEIALNSSSESLAFNFEIKIQRKFQNQIKSTTLYCQLLELL